MRTLPFTILLLLTFVPASGLLADAGSATASTGSVLEAATKARRLTDPPPLAVVGILEDGLEGSCTLRAALRGEPRKGVKGTFDAILIDGNTGNTLSDLGRKTGKTGRDGLLTVDYPVPRIGDFAVQAAMVVELSLGGGKRVTDFEFSCELIDQMP